MLLPPLLLTPLLIVLILLNRRASACASGDPGGWLRVAGTTMLNKEAWRLCFPSISHSLLQAWAALVQQVELHTLGRSCFCLAPAGSPPLLREAA